MVLAGHGVLEGIADALADTLGFESALGAAPFDRDPRLLQSLHFEGRAENLPGHTAKLSREDLSECLDLFFCRSRLHDEDALAVALMNGFRPVENRRALHAREIDAAA